MYLGIDLGTSNSAIVGNHGGQLRLFKTVDGSDVLPSVIFVDRRGHRLYGKRAYEQTILSPDNVAKGFKRLMGTSTPFEFRASGQAMTPEECSAEILRQLVTQAAIEGAAKDVAGTAITIPAAFNQMQSEATLRAASAAGLDKVILLQEPIAAAMAAMTTIKNRSGQFLIYDLGGGTFDLALVQSLNGAINVVGHEGINMLGGQDFDRTLVNSIIRPWLTENFSLPSDFQKVDRYGRLLGKALIAAERAKIDLSGSDRSTIFASDEDIQVKDDDGRDIYLDIELSRFQLDEMVEPALMQTIELTRSIIKANGYSNQDIDRIVLIGGPTKMPWIRDRVPRELGIPCDASVDPMTAVALGAAVYAESREWKGSVASRKATRASVQAGGDTGISFDYPARIASDVARLRVKAEPRAVAARLTVQVDAPSHGWTSGRVAVIHDTNIDLPVKDIGENQFKVTVFDGAGLPKGDSSKTISIARTHVTASAIPATQTISVKVRSGTTRMRNALQPIIQKGTPLPAKGVQQLRAAYGIGPDMPGKIEMELYQDESAANPDLNLFIGALRINHHDLPDGLSIKEGDPVVFHWAIDESSLLTATVELPNQQQTFSSRRFYVDQAGHRSFEGEEGRKLVEASIASAEQDAAKVVEAIGLGAKQDTDTIEEKIEQQRRNLLQASTGDERRSITETIRRVRQDIARIVANPNHRARVLQMRVADVSRRYSDLTHADAPSADSERFDNLAASAANEIKRQTSAGFDLAESIVDQMEAVFWQSVWKKPQYVVELFRRAARDRHLSADKAAFDLLVGDGENAIETGDIDELRGITVRLWDTMISTDGIGSDTMRLASVLRG
jgi:molecular chaperone DnaK